MIWLILLSQGLNIAACGVIWAAAMFFYLRHDRPECARHHYVQVALILVAVGSFAAGVEAIRGEVVAWWVVLFRMGAAMLAARSLWRWRCGDMEPTS